VIGLRDEPAPPATEPLLVPVMLGGKRAGPPRNLETARRLFAADLARLPEPVRRIANPEPLEAAFSDALKRLTEDTRAEALRRAGAR
jgi:nicotinate phosphoribosyltransferase